MNEAADDSNPKAIDAKSGYHVPLLILEHVAPLVLHMFSLPVYKCKIVSQRKHYGSICHHVDVESLKLFTKSVQGPAKHRLEEVTSNGDEENRQDLLGNCPQLLLLYEDVKDLLFKED